MGWIVGILLAAAAAWYFWPNITAAFADPGEDDEYGA